MKSFVLLCLSFFGLLPAVFAQTLTHPPQDDSNLYYGSLRFIRAVHLHSLAASSPKETATIQYALRQQLQVSENDYAILVQEAAALDSTVQTYQRGSGKGTSSEVSVGAGPKQQVAATVDRLAITTQITQKLSVELSSDGWAKFRAFVNGPFRQSTTATTFSK